MFYKHKKAASVVVFQPAMSPVGTKRTNWAGLIMSVDWG